MKCALGVTTADTSALFLTIEEIFLSKPSGASCLALAPGQLLAHMHRSGSAEDSRVSLSLSLFPPSSSPCDFFLKVPAALASQDPTKL